MSVFNPLGFIAFFTIIGRILIQDVWRSGINWDEPLCDSDFVKWSNWISRLPEIKKLTIPRCYLSSDQGVVRNELHVFCDASKYAFAAVAYRRIVYMNGQIQVAFIAGKSKVAPLKPLSIPRLEQEAAVIGVRLAGSVQTELEVQFDQRKFWSDSQTVLQWIRSDPRLYQTFVSHRLGEIDELSNSNEWAWISSKDNPADDAKKSNSPHTMMDYAG